MKSLNKFKSFIIFNLKGHKVTYNFNVLRIKKLKYFNSQNWQYYSLKQFWISDAIISKTQNNRLVFN